MPDGGAHSLHQDREEAVPAEQRAVMLRDHLGAEQFVDLPAHQDLEPGCEEGQEELRGDVQAVQRGEQLRAPATTPEDHQRQLRALPGHVLQGPDLY